MTTAIVAVASAVLMEPAAALLHRAVMHRRGWAWHRSHHRSGGRRGLERNDLYPVVLAATTVGFMVVASLAGANLAVWAGVGVTAYGLAYLAVHDLCIHERCGPAFRARGWYLRWVAESHGIHHRTGAAPYGFLCPIVPRTSVAFSGADTRARVEKTS